MPVMWSRADLYRRDYKYAKPHQRMLDFLLDDSSEDNAESEITAFMRERADPDTDSLAWWKDNSDKYSRLSVLVRRYLAVPAISVPSERIFSAAGLIVTKLRHCLASIKLFSLTKTLYHNDRITFMNVTWHNLVCKYNSTHKKMVHTTWNRQIPQ